MTKALIGMIHKGMIFDAPPVAGHDIYVLFEAINPVRYVRFD